ncbi:MAG TPA: ABC transporter substrate-binding protein [Acidimicrobiia bacterium]|nr:ABC transporter substrate-binding protein [Acidimicrobiia bacterium]
MKHRFRKGAHLGLVLTLLTGVVVSASGGGDAGAVRNVRGFDGSRITVAALGIVSQFPGVPLGVNARITRFNDSNELKGVKIKFTEFADDKQDPATALSEARRLVTQSQVFAIVGDTSQYNPADYFKQQHVPYFGWDFDNTYCSPKPTTALWGFSYDGCFLAENPSFVSDTGKTAYVYVSQKTGKKNPSIVVFGNDTTSGKSATKLSAIAYQNAGFKIADIQNKLPTPPIADYTPYVQQILTGDNGKAPDSVVCDLAIDCIPIWNLLKANNYQGIYISGLYSDLIVKQMGGSAATGTFVGPTENTPGMNQLKKDLDAYQSGASSKIDSGVIAAYSSADMFIQALKTVAKKGKGNITPENVQKAAATQTWQIKGLAGPTKYPQATVYTYPACFSLFYSDGTAWSTAVPYTCSTKKFKPVLKGS